MTKLIILVLAFVLFTASSAPTRAATRRTQLQRLPPTHESSDSLDLRTVIRLRAESSGTSQASTQVNVNQIVNGEVLPPVNITATSSQDDAPAVIEVVTRSDGDSSETIIISPTTQQQTPSRIDRRDDGSVRIVPSPRNASNILHSFIAYVKALFS